MGRYAQTLELSTNLKLCTIPRVRARFKYDPKIMYDLRIITNLKEKEIINELEKLKTNEKYVKEFYLATGRFPDKKEDKFIITYGFEQWYNVYKSGLVNVP